MKKFPSIVYATWEDPENGDSYLNVHEDGVPEVDENTKCAVYKLVETGEVTVTREYKAARKR